MLLLCYGNSFPGAQATRRFKATVWSYQMLTIMARQIFGHVRQSSSPHRLSDHCRTQSILCRSLQMYTIMTLYSFLFFFYCFNSCDILRNKALCNAPKTKRFSFNRRREINLPPLSIWESDSWCLLWIKFSVDIGYLFFFNQNLF